MEQFVKRDTETGPFMDVKQDGTPFKGVRKEKTRQQYPIIYAAKPLPWQEAALFVLTGHPAR